MKTLKIADTIPPSGDRALIGKSKIIGPIVALAFPTLVVILLVLGLIRIGFSLRSFLEHSGLVVTLIPGLIAMGYWCKLYFGPAIHALKVRDAIYSENGYLIVFDHRYTISNEASISYNNSKILIRDDGKVISEIPGYFIKMGIPGTEFPGTQEFR